MPTTSNLDRAWSSQEPAVARDFGDHRRQQAFTWLSERMCDHQSCVINQICANETERKRAQRFVNNPSLKVGQIIEACCLAVHSPCFDDQTIINVIDQSVIALNSAVGRMERGVEELGFVANGLQCGQNLVASLAVRASDYAVLGLNSLLFHSVEAQATKGDKRLGVDHRPFRYRNSDKWVQAARQANIRAQNARRVIHVIDREADSLAVIGRILESAGTTPSELIVRACFGQRKVIACGQDQYLGAGKIKALLAQKPVEMCYCVEVPEDLRSKLVTRDLGLSRTMQLKTSVRRRARRAILQVKSLRCLFDKQAILRSSNSSLQGQLRQELLNSTPLCQHPFTYLQIQEVDTQGRVLNPQEYSDAINWLLLTSLPVDNTEQICQVIDIYRHRFGIIEQFFRCLKKDGFQVQRAQQQSLQSLQIVIAMAAKASALVMKMISARDRDEGFVITDDFTKQQIEVLGLCLTRYQGKTQVQQNHHPPDQLSWAVWIIARMGGWKPENKQRPPGPKTLQRGLEIFAATYNGVALVKQWPLDVSQP
ncbi:MAG: hypothetical protein AAGJ90_22645 [Pseudomonadota bacterium]